LERTIVNRVFASMRPCLWELYLNNFIFHEPNFNLVEGVFARWAGKCYAPSAVTPFTRSKFGTSSCVGARSITILILPCAFGAGVSLMGNPRLPSPARGRPSCSAGRRLAATREPHIHGPGSQRTPSHGSDNGHGHRDTHTTYSHAYRTHNLFHSRHLCQTFGDSVVLKPKNLHSDT
jgi:hypothetical protein